MVVGFGRVGGALALGLHRAGWAVTVFPRSGESVRRAVALGLALADLDDLKRSDVCILAVPDSAILPLATNLKHELGPGTALVHCAGSLDLGALAHDPELALRPRGSFHPLVAISSAEDSLAGHSVAIAANAPALGATFRKMAKDLGLIPLEVPEARRAAYHAGAVLAAGGLVTLASAAIATFESAGLAESDSQRALLPLMRSALKGIERRGIARGLTGPIARGDLSVVQAHLAALPSHLAEIYRALSVQALKVVGHQLPVETRNALERLLKPS